MSNKVNPSSPYEKRLQLVVETIKTHEALGDEAASTLAAHVLHAIDHIPERIR